MRAELFFSTSRSKLLSPVGFHSDRVPKSTVVTSVTVLLAGRDTYLISLYGMLSIHPE